MRFPSLRSAGRDLALKLEAHRKANDVIVLGIALGGVPVAYEVAKYLSVPLDLVIIRRLLAPQGPGSQTCAVNSAAISLPRLSIGCGDVAARFIAEPV